MDLLDVVEGGRATYVTSLAHCPEAETLSITLTQNPNVDRDHGVLFFAAIQGYRSLVEDEDERSDLEAGVLLDNLLGIDEQKAVTGTHYLIKTTSREITFVTGQPPVWRLL